MRLFELSGIEDRPSNRLTIYLYIISLGLHTQNSAPVTPDHPEWNISETDLNFGICIDFHAFNSD